MRPGSHQAGAVLRLDVLATPLAVARITSILAHRQFDVVTMDIAAPVDGVRRITIEVDTADDIRVQQLVKFLNRSSDVVKVIRLSDDMSHNRRGAFVTVTFPEGRLAEAVAIARAFSAEIVEADRTRCTVFTAAEPARVDDLVKALSGFTIRELVMAAPLRIPRPLRKHTAVDRGRTWGQR
ncbi:MULTISPECIES: acetolactate synthase small subunit [Streptomyces]|uniref:acetolactate synthase small subunit n=1 Tax=Streptomyces lycopersici TaxID=2974589 RepID=UPI0021CE70AB|nr:acetolactate synthase small subunit [Streptomyces sp. NEAU-383]